MGISPTSSRKSVPPWAAASRPGRSRLASVKAPATWPKSSDSSSVPGRAEQWTVTNGRLAPRAVDVERPGDQLLAGAGLAEDEDGSVRVRHLGHHLEDLDHPRIAGDDAGEIVLGEQVALQAPVAPPQGLALARPQEEEPGHFRKLGEEGAAVLVEAVHALAVFEIDHTVDLAAVAQRSHEDAAAADEQGALARAEAVVFDQVRQVDHLAGLDRLAHQRAAVPALGRGAAARGRTRRRTSAGTSPPRAPRRSPSRRRTARRCGAGGPPGPARRPPPRAGASRSGRAPRRGSSRLPPIGDTCLWGQAELNRFAGQCLGPGGSRCSGWSEPQGGPAFAEWQPWDRNVAKNLLFQRFTRLGLLWQEGCSNRKLSASKSPLNRRSKGHTSKDGHSL